MGGSIFCVTTHPVTPGQNVEGPPPQAVLRLGRAAPVSTPVDLKAQVAFAGGPMVIGADCFATKRGHKTDAAAANGRRARHGDASSPRKYSRAGDGVALIEDLIFA